VSLGYHDIDGGSRVVGGLVGRKVLGTKRWGPPLRSGLVILSQALTLNTLERSTGHCHFDS
jgi:hypothetical protein